MIPKVGNDVLATKMKQLPRKYLYLLDFENFGPGIFKLCKFAWK